MIKQPVLSSSPKEIKGKQIITIEGFSEMEAPPLQKAFMITCPQ
jgi:aerobic-type carbon monoxide dehydrogenase small subunit (CoxS/CutS family)